MSPPTRSKQECTYVTEQQNRECTEIPLKRYCRCARLLHRLPSHSAVRLFARAVCQLTVTQLLPGFGFRQLSAEPAGLG